MSSATPARPSLRWLNAVLLGTALVALFLVVHNYGVPLLPRRATVLAAADIKPADPQHPHVYAVAFDASEPNRPGIDRSDVTILDDGIPLGNPMRDRAELFFTGGERLVHEPGRVLFSTKYNDNPAANGHTYTLLAPRLYSRSIGLGATGAFALSLLGLFVLNRRRPPTPPPAPRPATRWRLHLVGAALLFLAGLYCNTGTLAPYAITTFPQKIGPYLYNPDHAHFKALFSFVDGAAPAQWDGAILLRRILYPVLAYPFMKVGGFEIGGAIASLFWNLVGFVAAAYWSRRRIGERGAIFLLWLLALYPGAAYWGGLPYLYALIAPLSLLLLLALTDLVAASGRRFLLLSLAMGVAYLAYDFVAFFLPATVCALAWRRRWAAAAISTVIQILPLALWIVILHRVFGQAPENSNTGTYGAILAAYQHGDVWGAFLAQLPKLAETLLVVFFGANFTFIPALFLLTLALNPATSRVRLHTAEWALLAVALGIFLFNHFAPDYPGWQMRGTWISRLYQPVFPVFLLFAARWWQALPPLPSRARAGLSVALGAIALGNALIVFGPILNNPARVSETAFYRFYNHIDRHFVYERYCLVEFGRHPLGFPAPAK